MNSYYLITLPDSPDVNNTAKTSINTFMSKSVKNSLPNMMLHGVYNSTKTQIIVQGEITPALKNYIDANPITIEYIGDSIDGKPSDEVEAFMRLNAGAWAGSVSK